MAIQLTTNVIEEKLATLTESLVNLATKDDICTLIQNVEIKFAAELSERDRKLMELEDKLNVMSDQRYDDLQYSKCLCAKIDILEIKLADWQAKLADNIREIVQKESDGDAYSDDDDDLDNTQKEPLDLLVISDSICHHLDVDLINPGGKNKLICRPGAKIEDLRNVLISFESGYKIEKLIVNVITNHIPDETPSEIARGMLEFTEDIKRNMPETTLFVSLVLPKYSSSWLKGINCLNKHICDASRRDGFHIIQHPYFAGMGSINEALLAWDKIHLSRMGIKQLGVDFKSCLSYYKNV